MEFDHGRGSGPGGKTLQSRVISEQGQKTVKRVTHGLKFAAKVYKPPPCVGAVCHVSGDRLTPVEPRQVLVWKAGRACVANDPREDFGLRRPSSGTSTPLASCASSPTTRPSKHAQTFLPGPIHEEGSTSRLSANEDHEYVNLPAIHIEDTSTTSASDIDGLPDSAYPDCQPASLYDCLFYVHGEQHFALLDGSDSGVPDSDAGIPRTPKYMKLGRIRPDTCDIGVSHFITISLADANGISLNEDECTIQYCRHNGKQLEFVRSGRRGINKYEVETYTPCFDSVGERLVVVLTRDGTHIITVARLSVTAPAPVNRYNIFMQSPSQNGVSDVVRQVASIISNQVQSSDEDERPICGNLHYVGGGESQSTEFAHGLLDFVLNGECGGLPSPLSLRHLLASLPNLREILEAYHRSDGSLQHLVDVVRQECPQQTVVQDIEFLVEQCNQEISSKEQHRSPRFVENGSHCFEISSDEVVSTKYDSAPELLESSYPIYDEVIKSQTKQSDATSVNHEYAAPSENLQPQYTGLKWPSKLDKISEKTRVGLLTQVRDKTMSTNKAIENARDYMYASKPMSAPTTPILAKKRKRGKKKDSRQQSIGLLEILKKMALPAASNKNMSDSQSGLSTDDADSKSRLRHKKGRKIRSEEEQQQIRRQLSASSGDTLVGDTSSVSTTATAGTTSLTSASSAEKKVEKRKKQNDEKPTRTQRISSDSGIADVHVLHETNASVLAELKERIKERIKETCHSVDEGLA